MRAVDVRVAQQDRASVAELLDVEVLADAGAERGDERLDLLVAEHLVGARLLDVQDLPAQRQDRLGAPIAAALRAAAGRRALDDEELALLRVALRAVRELAGKERAVERALALHQIARLARGLARAERGEALVHDATRVWRVLLEVLTERVVHRRGDLPRDLGVPEPRLRLTFELRLLDLHADDRGETLAHVLGRQVRVRVLQLPVLPRVRVERSRERVAEAGEVGAAVDRVDVVREGVDAFREGVVVLERDLHDGVVLVGLLDVDGLVVERLVRPIKVADERHDPAVEVVVRLGVVALVVERQEQALVQVGGLAEPLLDDRGVPLDHREHLRVRREARDRAGEPRTLLPLDARRRSGSCGFATRLHGARRLAALVRLRVDLAVAMHLDDELGRERVHDRDADAVESAGDLVARAAELAAGVEDRVHDLERGLAGLLLLVRPGCRGRCRRRSRRCSCGSTRRCDRTCRSSPRRSSCRGPRG